MVLRLLFYIGRYVRAAGIARRVDRPGIALRYDRSPDPVCRGTCHPSLWLPVWPVVEPAC